MTRIIIDSTIDLPEQYRRQVHIVPLTIHFGTEELLDGVDIDRQRFYERLVESDVLPTTSQPSPDASPSCSIRWRPPGTAPWC